MGRSIERGCLSQWFQRQNGAAVGVLKKMGARISLTPDRRAARRGPRGQENFRGWNFNQNFDLRKRSQSDQKPFRRVRPGGRSQLENAPSNIGNLFAQPAEGPIGNGFKTATFFNAIARIPLESVVHNRMTACLFNSP